MKAEAAEREAEREIVHEEAAPILAEVKALRDGGRRHCTAELRERGRRPARS